MDVVDGMLVMVLLAPHIGSEMDIVLDEDATDECDLETICQEAQVECIY